MKKKLLSMLLTLSMLLSVFSVFAVSVSASQYYLFWPLPTNVVAIGRYTSAFGPRPAPTSGASTNHRGVDLPAPMNTPVYAAFDGEVTVVGSSSARGNYVVVYHPSIGLSTLYQHLASATVYTGQLVAGGAQIAISGNSGVGTGPHLHFGVMVGKATDPNHDQPGYNMAIDPLGSNITYAASSGTAINPTISDNPDDHTFPTRDLYYTSPVMTGDDVMWVQAVLYKIGFNITIDGSFGPASHDNVALFQSYTGLTANGIVDAATRAMLLQYWNTFKSALIPTVGITSTNDFASTQTVTLHMTDDAGVNGYSWATVGVEAGNVYTPITPIIATTINVTVSAPGQYYLVATDTSANLSELAYATFYSSTFNGNGGTVSTSTTSVLTMEGNSIAMPTASRSGYTFLGWSESSSATSATYGGMYAPNANRTFYAVWKYNDTTKPTVSISSTNNIAGSQTVTLNLSDNVGVTSYYWGTSSSPASSSFTSITSATSTSVTKTVSAAGTYYLIANDADGNTSSTASMTFYSTALNGNGGSVSPTSVVTKSGNSFVLPTATRSGYIFRGWSTSSTATSATYGAGAAYVPGTNTTLYAVWEPVVVTSIAVNTAPTKTTYEIGEALNTSGLKVNVSYSDGTTQTITSGFTTSGFSSATTGTKTVTVQYEGKTTSFTVTVVNPTMTGIGITSLPGKTTYIEGQQLDTTGLAVTAYYSNGSTENVTDYTVSGYDSTPGEKTVTVMYSGFTASFSVTVSAKTITHIEITEPSKLTYIVGETLDTEGMTVTAFYDNGTSEMIEADKCAIEGFDSSVAGVVEVTVFYNGMTQSFTVTVNEAQADILYGDVDSDGGIKASDLSTLIRYVGGAITVSVDSNASDVNGDGSIKANDVSLLSRKIGGAVVTLGPEA